MNKNSIILLLFVCITFVACEDDNQIDDFDQLDQMGEEILALIEDKSADDVTACRYIGFGDKACGGYWSYLIYSVDQVDTLELMQKIQTYNSLENELNIKWGMVSDCSVPIPPVLGLFNGECANVAPEP